MESNKKVVELELEDSMLRSILLFNHTKLGEKGRKDLMLKAVLSIVTYGKGRYGVREICEILKCRFKLGYDHVTLLGYLKKLEGMGLVSHMNEKYEDVSGGEPSSALLLDIDSRTERLYDGVLKRVEQNTKINQTEREQIIQNIREALTQYFKMFGLAYCGLKDPPSKENALDAVGIARRGLREKLQDVLVGALCDVVCRPTNEERSTLEMWAKAYITMAVMNLDPSLRNFKATIMGKKTFVVDTDVALYVMTDHAHLSLQYKEMMKALKSIGCKIVLPSFILKEVRNHIDAAVKRYEFNGSHWGALTDEFLVGENGNVFVEDYINTIRNVEEKRNMPFEQYIRNFYEKNYPGFLEKRLRAAFEGAEYKDFSSVKLDRELDKKLADGILEETEKSAKGSIRGDEANREIAENDAKMYLWISEQNLDDKQDMPLSFKNYLLSDSRKIIKIAKSLDIYKTDVVCSPFSLICSLQEVGTLSDELGVVDLFANPFLAVTAARLKTTIGKLLEAGVDIKYADVERLRLDVDVCIDRILTCNTVDDRLNEAKRLNKRGYFFANDLVEANLENEKKTLQLKEKEEEVVQLREQIERLKKEKAKQSYQIRVGHKNRRRGS